MMVKMGFNTSYGHDKFDVGLDETDLARILAEAGIPPDTALTSRQVFQILLTEAERYCAAQRAQMVPAEAEACQREIKRLTGLRHALLELLRQQCLREPVPDASA